MQPVNGFQTTDGRFFEKKMEAKEHQMRIDFALLSEQVEIKEEGKLDPVTQLTIHEFFKLPNLLEFLTIINEYGKTGGLINQGYPLSRIQEIMKIGTPEEKQDLSEVLKAQGMTMDQHFNMPRRIQDK